MTAQDQAAAVLLVHPALLPTDTPGHSRCSGCMASVAWRAGGAAPHLTEHARALHAIADHQVAMLAAAGLLAPEPPQHGDHTDHGRCSPCGICQCCDRCDDTCTCAGERCATTTCGCSEFAPVGTLSTPTGDPT